jgi:hypothetical protein
MAIEDFYNDIQVLAQTKTNNGVGGKGLSWVVIDTIRGVINQDVGSESPNGKTLERTAYKGYTEVNTNISASVRLKDSEGNIYRIKGKPKNTMNMNHHYRLELEYFQEDNE